MVAPRTIYKTVYTFILLALFPIATFRIGQISQFFTFYTWSIPVPEGTEPVLINDELFLPLELLSILFLFFGLILYTIRSSVPFHQDKTLSHSTNNDNQLTSLGSTSKWYRSYRRTGVDSFSPLSFRLGRLLVLTGASFFLSAGIFRVAFECWFTPNFSLDLHKTEYVSTYVLMSLEFFFPLVLYGVLFHNDPARVPSSCPDTMHTTAFDNGDFLQQSLQYLPPTLATSDTSSIAPSLSQYSYQQPPHLSHEDSNIDQYDDFYNSKQQQYNQQQQRQEQLAQSIPSHGNSTLRYSQSTISSTPGSVNRNEHSHTPNQTTHQIPHSAIQPMPHRGYSMNSINPQQQTYKHSEDRVTFSHGHIDDDSTPLP